MNLASFDKIRQSPKLSSGEPASNFADIDRTPYIINIAPSSLNPASFLRPGPGDPKSCARHKTGANGAQASRPLSRPSPSANLVGIGKGNLGAHSAFPTIPSKPVRRDNTLSQAITELA